MKSLGFHVCNLSAFLFLARRLALGPLLPYSVIYRTMAIAFGSEEISLEIGTI